MDPPRSCEFRDSDWANVGSPGFSGGEVESFSLALFGGAPYVAFTDNSNGSKVSLQRFDGDTWVNVGAPGFSAGAAAYVSLAFSGPTPYVAFRDEGNGGKVTVMRLE